MSVNDITGDRIVTDIPSEKFKSGWEAIWGNKTQEEVQDILDSPSILIPNGMSLEGMRSFITLHSKVSAEDRAMEEWLEKMGYNDTPMFGEAEDD